MQLRFYSGLIRFWVDHIQRTWLAWFYNAASCWLIQRCPQIVWRLADIENTNLISKSSDWGVLHYSLLLKHKRKCFKNDWPVSENDFRKIGADWRLSIDSSSKTYNIFMSPNSTCGSTEEHNRMVDKRAELQEDLQSGASTQMKTFHLKEAHVVTEYEL